MYGGDLLLSEALYAICNDFREMTEYFLASPFDYAEEIKQELMEICDRMEALEAKLNDIYYVGSFRY